MSLILGVLYILVIGAVTVSMAVLLLMGKKETYNKRYLCCQGMVILWCVSQILILLSDTPKELAFSYLLGNIGVCFVGACWFGFAFSYSGRKLPRFIQYLPFLLSAVHYLLVLTNRWHHLYYTSFSKDEVVHGIFFYTNVTETYLFVAAGAIILYRSIDREGKADIDGNLETKTDADTAKILIIMAVLVPIVFNIFYVTDAIKSSFDITPLGFGISGILVLLATIKYRFMEVNIEAFDTVLSGLTDGVAIFDKNGKCTFYNRAFLKYMGQECILKAENIKLQITAMSYVEENIHMDSTGRYLQVQVYQSLRGMRDSGQELQKIGLAVKEMSEASLSDMAYSEPTVFVIKDISRYYELLRQTRELAVTNERLALEKERNRIAQQVHDTAGHTLTMIQSYMKLAAVSNEKQETAQVQEYLEDARKLTSKGIKELRESINQLRREAGSELVTQGILQLTDQVKELTAEVTVQGEDSEKYSHLSRVLYDCVRESITNTLKYANANKLDIVLRFKEDAVELMIADDGIGCAGITDGNGLAGIRERVEKAGGVVRFITGENEGFLTRIQIPIINYK